MSSFGTLGYLPIRLFSNVCDHLELSEILKFRATSRAIEKTIDDEVFEGITMLKVVIVKDSSTMEFKKPSGWTGEIHIDEKGNWKELVRKCRAIRDIDFRFERGQHFHTVFQFLKKLNIKLRSIKINIIDDKQRSMEKIRNLQCCLIDLVTIHRKTINYLELKTQDGQVVKATLSPSNKSLVLKFTQQNDRKHESNPENQLNHVFVYNLFCSLLEFRNTTSVTLEVNSKYDATLALQKAFQAAVPYRKRYDLEELILEFGSSLQTATVAQMKDVLLKHVDEFHHTTPKLQHFKCNLPHFKIDMSLDCLKDEIREQVRRTRKDSDTPYIPDIVVLKPVNPVM